MQYSTGKPKDPLLRRRRSSKAPDYPAEYMELYERCISAGCDREARDNNGNTPIFAFLSTIRSYDAMDSDSAPDPKLITKMLGEHDVHVVNNAGDGLLHIVAGREEEKYHHHMNDGLLLFEKLIERCLDPKKENVRGATPVDVAAACGNEKILVLFARDE